MSRLAFSQCIEVRLSHEAVHTGCERESEASAALSSEVLMGRSRLFKLPDLVAGWLRIGSVSPQRAHISQPMPIRRSVGERGRGVVARQADHAVRIAAASRSPIRQDPSGAQRLAAQAAIPPSPG